MKNNLNKKENTAVQKTLIPGAAKTVKALRSVGYSNYDACEDILDNSVDAEATVVSVIVNSGDHETEFNSKGKPKKVIDSIMFADNGVGMDMAVLTEALRYGSSTAHDEAVDLGKFGMGLNAAGTSMGRRITVFTRKKGGPLCFGRFDLDEIIEKDDFVYTFQEVHKPALVEYFNEKINNSPHGTVVVVDKLDMLQNKDPNSFASTLRGNNHLARTFRELLTDPNRLKFYVNRTQVVPYDPLHLEDKGTIKYTDGWVSVPGFNTLKYRIACIRDASSYKGDSTVNSQGICWIRNGREISVNRTDPFWTSKFPDSRGFLVEISFGGSELDALVGVNVQKKLTNTVDQSLVDILKQEITPLYNQNTRELKAREKKRKKNNNQKSLDKEIKSYTEKVKNISKSLTLPPKLEAGRGPDKKPRKKREGSNVANNVVDINGYKSSLSSRDFVIEFGNWRKEGGMYEVHLRNDDAIVLTFNEDHPAVERGMLDSNSSNQKLSFKNIILALALSELLVCNDGDPTIKTALDSFREFFGRNCRQLTEKVTG